MRLSVLFFLINGLSHKWIEVLVSYTEIVFYVQRVLLLFKVCIGIPGQPVYDLYILRMQGQLYHASHIKLAQI